MRSDDDDERFRRYGSDKCCANSFCKGVGQVVIGMRKAAVPQSVAGVYNKKVFNAASPDDMEFSGSGWFTCTLKGEETMYIFLDKANKVCGISVNTPKVKSVDGVYVGMPVSKLKKVKNIQYEGEGMGDPYYYTQHGDTQIQYVISYEGPEVVRYMSTGDTY